MDYSPLSTFRWPYSGVDTMVYIVYHGTLSVGHTGVSIPWTVVHGPLSIDHTLMSIPWTIILGHSRWSIPWTILHGPLFVSGRYHGLWSMVHFPLMIL